MTGLVVGVAQGSGLVAHLVDHYSLVVGIVVTTILLALLTTRMCLRELGRVTTVSWARTMDSGIVVLLVVFLGIVGIRFDVLH